MESVDYEFLGAEEKAGSFVEPHGCLRTRPINLPQICANTLPVPSDSVAGNSIRHAKASLYSSARLHKSCIAINDEPLRTTIVESLGSVYI